MRARVEVEPRENIYWMFGARCGCKAPPIEAGNPEIFTEIWVAGREFDTLKLARPCGKSVVNLPPKPLDHLVMSCFSRLLGLICAVVPGLLFLAFSALFFVRWPQLGYVTGPLYSLLSLVTGAVCLYLGIGILFGRDATTEADANRTPQIVDSSAPAATSAVTPAATPDVTPAVIEAPALQAAPLPTEIIEPPRASAMPAEATPETVVSEPQAAVTIEKAPAPVRLDSPEIRIRQLASTRPNWQVTAPQLAHMANINMAVADATAREMASNGQAELRTGPNGETVYIFDLTNPTD